MDFIRAILAEYGPSLEKIQITEEPNNPRTETGGDGSSPGVRQAIIQGVLAAHAEIRRLGLQVEVGFKAAGERTEWGVAAFDIVRPLFDDVGPCDVDASCTHVVDGICFFFFCNIRGLKDYFHFLLG